MSWIALAASAVNTYLTNKNNKNATRENNAFQDRLSRTAHQREVKDLKSAGLNPILSARGSGAPQPSSAAAKVEPYQADPSRRLIEDEQIRLLQAQSRKTRAEALNTELQEPYNKALADVYGSVAGVPAVGAKAIGGAATGYGLYKGARAVGRVLKKRKLKRYRGRGFKSSRARSSDLRSKAFAPSGRFKRAFSQSWKNTGGFSGGASRLIRRGR